MQLRKFIAYLACCAVGVLAQQSTFAQGVITYLSNTDQPVAGSLALGLDYGSVGVEFQTGTNPEGYLLNNLQLLFADATGSPIFSGLNILICSNYVDSPGNPVSYFMPSQNPLTSGFYTYTPNSEAALDSNTLYWLLVYVTSIRFGSAYNLSYASTAITSSPDGWAFTGNTALGQAGYPIFSINATAVPEPSTFILMILGGVLIASKIKPSIAATRPR